MKPFNLEEYLKNPERKVVTRDGRPARIICTDAKSKKYQVVALVTKKDGKEILATFDTSGKYRIEHNSYLNLFFAPEKHEGWVNIYRNKINGESYCGKIYESEGDAKAQMNILTTIKIEWEE